MNVPDQLRTLKPRAGIRMRPRDAATLIVIDSDGPKPRVLMGRRRTDLAFMAGKYVFPGGRIDRADGLVAAVDALPAPLETKLIERMTGRPTARRARALALCAVRETFEETGVLVGETSALATTARSSHPIWASYFAEGVLPALDRMRMVARAITPPGRTRRFDTRFFAVPATAIAKALPVEDAADGELEDIAWLTFEEAKDLDLPHITHVVLDETERVLETESGYSGHPPVPFYFMRHGHFVREVI